MEIDDCCPLCKGTGVVPEPNTQDGYINCICTLEEYL